MYVKAQALYQERERSEIISGSDLHEIFRDLCDGEPSPSGFYKIPVERIEKLILSLPPQTTTGEFLSQAMSAKTLIVFNGRETVIPHR